MDSGIDVELLMDIKRAFTLLELDETASLAQVKLAYRDLAAVWHPDRHRHNPRLTSKAHARMQELNRAFEVVAGYLADAVDDRPQQSPQEGACPECGHPVGLGEDVLCSRCLARQEKAVSKFQINYNLLGLARMLATGVVTAIFVGLVLLVVYGGIFPGSRSGESIREVAMNIGFPAGGERKLTNIFKVDHFNVYERPELLQLQRDLAAIGYSVGPIDGIIGPLTLDAVNRLYTDFPAQSPGTSPGEVLRFAAMHGQVAAVYSNWKEIAGTGLLEEWVKRRNEHVGITQTVDDPQRLIRLLDLFSFDRAAPDALLLPATEILFTAGNEQGIELLISARSAANHQLLKVVDPLTGRLLLAAFVRSGQVLVTSLPVGLYELRRVNGPVWYGKRFLFGVETVHCSGGQKGRLEIQGKGRQHLELVDCRQNEEKADSPLSLFVF